MTLLSANQNAYIFRANDKIYYSAERKAWEILIKRGDCLDTESSKKYKSLDFWK